MKLLTKLLSAYIATSLLVSWSYADTSSKNSYSLEQGALSAMEIQLKSMLKQKIIKTPAVDPATALPPIILNTIGYNETTIDAIDDNQLTKKRFFEEFIAAAKNRTNHKVKYDGSYRYISYPMGDVAPNRGVCTDVVIRSYRKLGIDLQQLVHEDISGNFKLYPSRARWGNIEPDTNIDHRRVYNLQVFFQRYGESLPISSDPTDYQPGDLVTWKLGPKMPHIGIVVDEFSEEHPEHPMIVHNIGHGPKQEDILFSFPITGHYRYKPGKETPNIIPTSPLPSSASRLLVKKDKPISSANSPLEDPPSENSLIEAAFFLLH